MGQILHGSATTTEAIRRAIQHSHRPDPRRADHVWLEIEPVDNGHISSAALLALGRDPSTAEWRALHTSISKRQSFVELSAGTCLPTGAAFRKWWHGVSARPLNTVRATKVVSDFTAKG